MSEIHYSFSNSEEAPPNAQTLRFRGISGAECEDFVQSVRLIALAEGKEHDEGWMLHFATARLSGKALRRHAGLDKEIRKNWDLLVQALLDEYQEVLPGGIASSASIATSSYVFSQDNAGSSTLLSPQSSIVYPGLNVGRLRVIPTLSGRPNSIYVSRALQVTTIQADALQVQFLHSTELHKIFMIEWDNAENSEIRVPRYFLYIIGDSRKKAGKIFASNFGGVGPAYDCWRVSSGGVLEVSYTEQREYHKLKSQKVAVGMNDHTLTFVQDFDSWTRELAQGYHYEARLIFEPLSK